MCFNIFFLISATQPISLSENVHKLTSVHFCQNSNFNDDTSNTIIDFITKANTKNIQIIQESNKTPDNSDFNCK